jgi:hypothetical protein
MCKERYMVRVKKCSVDLLRMFDSRDQNVRKNSPLDIPTSPVSNYLSNLHHFINIKVS